MSTVTMQPTAVIVRTCVKLSQVPQHTQWQFIPVEATFVKNDAVLFR